MSHPTATKNAALNGITITHASLHSAYPGVTGANEISGGSYARKAVTINGASGGQRLQNASVVFDVPACSVLWVGYWNGTAFVDYAPNGGATPKNFMSIASSDTIYSASHGYNDDDPVAFAWGSAPGGLSIGTVYYVVNADTDSFQVAATPGGAAIDLTSGAGYQCPVCGITEATYLVGGQHTLTTSTFTIPD